MVFSSYILRSYLGVKILNDLEKKKKKRNGNSAQIQIIQNYHSVENCTGNCFILRISRRCHHGVMVKPMDCGIVVSKFVFQSCYYIHFRANTLGKDMNPLILPAMG